MSIIQNFSGCWSCLQPVFYWWVHVLWQVFSPWALEWSLQSCSQYFAPFFFFFFFGQLVFCFLSLKNIPVKVRNVVTACTWRLKSTHAILFLLQVAFLMLSKQTIFPTLLQLLSQEWMILKSLITTCLLQIRYVHCNSFKMLS